VGYLGIVKTKFLNAIGKHLDGNLFVSGCCETISGMTVEFIYVQNHKGWVILGG